MGFFDWFKSKEVAPVAAPQQFPTINYGFERWMSDWMYNDPQTGATRMFGVNAFNPDADPNGAAAMAKQYLTVKPNDRLNGAWNAWQPWDGGTQYLADYLQNKSGPDPRVSQGFGNLQQHGVVGGYPGQLMHNIAQYGGAAQAPTQALSNMMQFGGTGGPGHRGMSSAMQFGAPSAAGQFANNMAQFGVASEQSGRPLANRAYGQQTPAMNYLAPFMQPRPQQFQNPFSFQAPQLPGAMRFGGYR